MNRMGEDAAGRIGRPSVPDDLFGESGVCGPDANKWPAMRDAPDPGISGRPWWRYPGRRDFFELQAGGSVRIDWPSREIDRRAKRADGLLIWIAQPMSMAERIIWNPRFRRVKYWLDCLRCKWTG